MIARSDGASSRLGFSTRSRISCTRLSTGRALITPYWWIRCFGTRSTAITGASYRSLTSSSWRIQGVGVPAMMSSPRKTAKGSSPTRARAQRIARLPRPVTMMISDRPEATASSTTYWIIGLSTSGSISFGCALVAGRNRVPSPAAGNTALRTFMRSLYVPRPCGPTTSQEHERRHVGERARHGSDGGGADQEREGNAAQELEHVGRGADGGHVHELHDLGDVSPVEVR